LCQRKSYLKKSVERGPKQKRFIDLKSSTERKRDDIQSYIAYSRWIFVIHRASTWWFAFGWEWEWEWKWELRIEDGDWEPGRQSVKNDWSISSRPSDLDYVSISVRAQRVPCRVDKDSDSMDPVSLDPMP